MLNEDMYLITAYEPFVVYVFLNSPFSVEILLCNIRILNLGIFMGQMFSLFALMRREDDSFKVCVF